MAGGNGGRRSGNGREGLPPGLEGAPAYLLNWVSARLNLNLLGALRPLNITAGRWRVLVVLTARDGSSISEIAADCAMDQSTASRVIDQMERDGLAERRVRAEDNRVTEVHLTAKGERLHAYILPTAEEQAEAMLAALTPEERSAFLALLNTIAGAMRR